MSDLEKWNCGDVFFDRHGVFSNCCPTLYQLLAHDARSDDGKFLCESKGGKMRWTCIVYHGFTTDGKVLGGGHTEVVWDEDLMRAERIGSITFPPINL